MLDNLTCSNNFFKCICVFKYIRVYKLKGSSIYMNRKGGTKTMQHNIRLTEKEEKILAKQLRGFNLSKFVREALAELE